MRLLVPESFSYGDQPFPWDGLVDPKLFQRVTWLLVPFRPVRVPLISMESVIGADAMISARDTDVCLTGFGISSMIETVSFGACISPRAADVSLASSGVGVRMAISGVSSSITSRGKPITIGNSSRGVSMRTTKGVPDP